MLQVFKSAACTTIKVQSIDSLVDLFGSLEEFMSGHMREREVEEEDNMEGEPVWYVCLKTEKCCLKIFMEIRVGEKVC